MSTGMAAAQVSAVAAIAAAISAVASDFGGYNTGLSKNNQLFASHLLPGDDIITMAGTRVFIAAALAKPLESSVLDTIDSSQGEHLVLRPRRAT